VIYRQRSAIARNEANDMMIVKRREANVAVIVAKRSEAAVDVIYRGLVDVYLSRLAKAAVIVKIHVVKIFVLC
jgi:hypothetical protein